MERPADPGASLARLPGKDPHNNPGDVSVDFPVSVVLPAGGTGERTGLQTPKQFCGLMGRPLISYTAQAFERVSWIQCVVVVVATESLALMRDIAQRYRHSKVRVVPGGSTRHRSIRRGVQALREPEEQVGAGTPKVVIIHDAVRPFVDEDMLSKIAMAAKEHGCTDYDLDYGTECLHLALQYCGTNAKLIEGPPTLWKVSHRTTVRMRHLHSKLTFPCRSRRAPHLPRLIALLLTAEGRKFKNQMQYRQFACREHFRQKVHLH
uniref:CDP-L-ribitol pyrophosphorylase A n=1 Tax=Neogobius melanostomus TaxID=47308 RepID=A0A8C6U121_9GOBI